MMSIKQKLTGKPSIDRPWMQYYPQEMIEKNCDYLYSSSHVHYTFIGTFRQSLLLF